MEAEVVDTLELAAGRAERHRLNTLDDATIARLARRGSTAARDILEDRKRFEAIWAAGWKSGPYSKVPYPRDRYSHFRR